MRLPQQRLAVAIAVLYRGLGAILQAEAQGTTSKPEQLGQVNFSVSCAGEAQGKFYRDRARYHSCDWKQGQSTFDENVRLDQRYGMAYWGLGLDARAKRHFEKLVVIASQSDAIRPELAHASQVLSQRQRQPRGIRTEGTSMNRKWWKGRRPAVFRGQASEKLQTLLNI